MDSVNFLLCSLAVLTCVACMVLLFRAYAATGVKLLLWSAACFVFLAANNALLFVDVVIDPQMDLKAERFVTALLGVAVLLYGLFQEAG